MILGGGVGHDSFSAAAFVAGKLAESETLVGKDSPLRCKATILRANQKCFVMLPRFVAGALTDKHVFSLTAENAPSTVDVRLLPPLLFTYTKLSKIKRAYCRLLVQCHLRQPLRLCSPFSLQSYC